MLRGIAQYAQQYGRWSILHEEMTIDSGLPSWLMQSAVDGVIARVDQHTIEPLRNLRVPIIDVRCRHRYDGVTQVETNDQMVAEQAFDHLTQRGFQRLGFCGYHGAHFSENRFQPFQELAERHQIPLSTYEVAGTSRNSLSEIERAGIIDADPLHKWLRSLTVPCGIFVCNDICGQQVLNACRNLGILVPDDIGVVGVDDDDAICTLCDPPLSSVKPDTQRIGFLAAQKLEHQIRTGHTNATTEYVPPLGVSQRLSTQVVALEDREIAKACRFIREHACDGIDVSHVVQLSSLSRRQLERRFREQLNRTPFEEITAIQVARVKQLLEESTMILEEIADLAGYSHKERMSAVFKRHTGLSPGAYRKQHRGQ